MLFQITTAYKQYMNLNLGTFVLKKASTESTGHKKLETHQQKYNFSDLCHCRVIFRFCPSIKTSQSATICFASFNFSMNQLEETVTQT